MFPGVESVCSFLHVICASSKHFVKNVPFVDLNVIKETALAGVPPWILHTNQQIIA